MTIHKRHQRSGGQATRRLYHHNEKMCARCGLKPRYLSTRGYYYTTCADCHRLRGMEYRSRGAPGLKRRQQSANHVINPRTDEQGGFICEKCLNPVKRKELNSHWRECVRGEK